MRFFVVAAFVLAAVVAACVEREPVAPRSYGIRKSALTSIYDTATLATSKSQAIKGWGFDPGISTGVFLTTTSPSGPAAEDSLYSMGATFIRDQIDPSLYVSGTTLATMDLDTSLLKSYVAKWDTAKLKGMGYVLSVWNPPSAFVSGTSLKHTSDSAFVAYMTAVLRYLNGSAVGLPMAVSVANEPDVHGNGPQYSDSQWQNVIEMTRGSLSYLGYTGLTLYGPETSTYDSVSDFLGGSNFGTLDGGYLSTAVGAFAWHTYGTCNYSTVQSFITSYSKDAWVTEFSKPTQQGSNDLAFAIDGLAALGAQLTMVSNNYWAWWYGFAVQDADTTGGKDSTNGDYGALIDADHVTNWVSYSRRYFLFQKLWTLVKPGSWNLQKFTYSSDTTLRINGNGNQATCAYRDDIYAFENSSDTSTVIVVSNHTSNSKYITVNGFPTTYTRQHSWRADSTTTDSLAVEDSSTVWVPSGQGTGRTVLYAPPRSVIVAIMQP